LSFRGNNIRPPLLNFSRYRHVKIACRPGFSSPCFYPILMVLRPAEVLVMRDTFYLFPFLVILKGLTLPPQSTSSSLSVFFFPPHCMLPYFSSVRATFFSHVSYFLKISVCSSSYFSFFFLKNEKSCPPSFLNRLPSFSVVGAFSLSLVPLVRLFSGGLLYNCFALLIMLCFPASWSLPFGYLCPFL